jgi:hypothetical protein
MRCHRGPMPEFRAALVCAGRKAVRSKMHPLSPSLRRDRPREKADGPLHRLVAGWHCVRYRAARARKYLRNLLCGLLSEVRSFHAHIQILISTKLYQEGLQIEPPPSLTGVPFPLYCKRVFACSQDIQNLAAKYAGFGLVDFQTFAEGWKAGVEWALRTRSESPDLVEVSTEVPTTEDYTRPMS